MKLLHNSRSGLKVALLALALIGAGVAPTDADAHGRYRSRASVGIFFGVPAPVYYYPRWHHYPSYYYPPTVLAPAPAAPPVYIEQPQTAAPAPSSPAQASSAYWYYCRDTQAYYPYVQQCATPWEPVVPHSTPRS